MRNQETRVDIQGCWDNTGKEEMGRREEEWSVDVNEKVDVQDV